MSKEEYVDVYDVVMICNGHYNTPIIPDLPGQELFQGKILHSHHYRSVDLFKGKRVLVIGAGPSGLDIAFQISPVAGNIVISHHVFRREIKGEYPSNVSKKPEVLRIKNHEEIEFVDGSTCCFDVILHCTGYRYNFPFLHDSCGITIEDKRIQPLYKHIIHIEKPTMCFIGIPYYVCAFQMFDVQVL
jgi:dimethylaniline monooxygenase (N-oxide forming)